MATIKQTFEDKLPHYLAQLACHYTSTNLLEMTCPSKYSLVYAFNWKDTPQGLDFWRNIDIKYFIGE